MSGISRPSRSFEVPMSRIRIIIPAATIERTKLYLMRGAALLLCVLIFPLAAHASPFDSGISSIQTLFTGFSVREEDARRSCSRHRYSGDGDQHPHLAMGLLTPARLRMSCN